LDQTKREGEAKTAIAQITLGTLVHAPRQNGEGGKKGKAKVARGTGMMGKKRKGREIDSQLMILRFLSARVAKRREKKKKWYEWEGNCYFLPEFEGGGSD